MSGLLCWGFCFSNVIALADNRRCPCTVKVEKSKVVARLVTQLGYA